MENTKQEEYLKLSDQELLDLAKKAKSNAIINALFIGTLAGIIIYSVAKSTYGFITLIPLYIIYRMVNNSKNDEDLTKVLKERNLEKHS